MPVRPLARVPPDRAKNWIRTGVCPQRTTAVFVTYCHTVLEIWGGSNSGSGSAVMRYAKQLRAGRCGPWYHTVSMARCPMQSCRVPDAATAVPHVGQAHVANHNLR